jgi:hypothetical protein
MHSGVVRRRGAFLRVMTGVLVFRVLDSGLDPASPGR